MTAGDQTVTKYAQILLDHSSFIKTILNVAMMFWLLRVISGSASYLSRKAGFVSLAWLSLWFNWHNWRHAMVREHFKFSNEESSLGKCHEQEVFWERCGAEIQRMIFLRWQRHFCTVNTILCLSFSFPPRENGDQRTFIMLYFTPPKHYTKFWIKIWSWPI